MVFTVFFTCDQKCQIMRCSSASRYCLSASSCKHCMCVVCWRTCRVFGDSEVCAGWQRTDVDVFRCKVFMLFACSRMCDCSREAPPATLATSPDQRVLCCCHVQLALAQQLKVLLWMTQSAASFPYLLYCLLDLQQAIMLLYRLYSFCEVASTLNQMLHMLQSSCELASQLIQMKSNTQGTGAGENSMAPTQLTRSR